MNFPLELFRLCNKQRTFELIRAPLHFKRLHTLALQLGSVKDTATMDDHVSISNAIRQKDAQKAVAQVNIHLARYQS